MKKSKFLSMLLAFVMLITCTANAVTGAFAATDPTITVNTVEAKPGDEITLTVSLSNNPGICSLRLAINYDSQLTLTAVEDAGLMNDHVFGRQLTANPYYVTWDDSLEDNDNTGNGALVYLTFKVSDEATSGTHNVWITYKHGEIYNLDLDDVDFELVDGGVTVVGGAHEHVFTNYVSDGNATCTSDGTKTAQCDFGCGTTDTIVDEGSKLSHSFTDYEPDNNATCTENGTKTASCDYGCGTTDTIEIADSELGHSFTHYESNNDATCTEDGTKTSKCDRCDETDTITDTGSKIPHSFRDYHSDNNATCTADGTKTAYCEYGCGTKETITDEGSKISHSFSNYIYNDDATYGADGTETAYCDYNCGESDTRVKSGSKLIDTIAPTGEVRVEKNGWKSFINTITFGLFFKDKFDVTITGEDNETGVNSIEYYKSSRAMTEEEVAALTAWTTGTSFSIEDEGKYVIYVKITDNAGNVTYISTDGLVIDNSVPQITGVEDGTSYCETVTATISGENIDTITVNGTVATVQGNKVELTAVSKEGTTYNLRVTTKSGNYAEVTVKVYLGHQFDNYISDNNATCMTDGTKTATCTHDCGTTDTVTDAGSKVAHKFTSYVSDGNATCTEDGTKTAHCDYNCGTTDTVTDEGSTLGHSFTSYVSDGNATCTEDGTKTAKCDRCDVTDTVADTGSALGHDYKLSSTVSATCEEDGKKVYVCTHDSSHTYEEIIEKLGHNWGEWTVTTDPTCTEKGVETRTCKNDATHTETRDVEALGHSFTNYVSDSNATCTVDGTKTAKCDHNCGTTDTVADEGSALGHSFTNYISDGNATCTEDGTKTAKCDRCDETNTIADNGSKLGHSFTNYIYNNDATYFEDGTETAKCDRCNETDTRIKIGTKLADTIAPTGEVKVEKNGWKSFINTITFGLFFKDKFDVTITGEDNETGVKSIEYYKSSDAMTEEEVTVLTEWTAGTSFSIEDDGKYVIYVKITDNAGNVTYISTDGLVIDNSVPQITGVEDGASYCETVTAAIFGEYIDIVTVNGTEIILDNGKLELKAISVEGTTYSIKATTKSGVYAEATIKVYNGHDFDNYTSDNNATCMTDGTKTATCTHDCGATDTITDVGSKVDHKFTSYVSDGNATCTEDGSKTAHCEYSCGTTDTVTDEGSALGHSFTNYISDGNATCTEDGTKTAKCDRCDVTDTVADTGSALGHDYKLSSTVPATCEVDGKKVYVCTHDSSHTYEETLEKLGHNWGEWVVTTDPTCTTKGVETRNCKNDATHTETREVEALGHSFTNYVSDENATCTVDGTKTAKCDHNCGESDTIADPGSALGHSFTNYISDGNATCTEDGTKTAKCDRCDVTDTVADTGSALGHDYKVFSTISATCDVDGKTVYVCSHDSSHTYEEIIEKLGHDWGEWEVTTEPTCTEKGVETRTCKNDASHTETREIDAIGHSFTNYVSDGNATCTVDGTKTAKCDHNCGMTDTITDEGSKIDHNVTEWTITKQPTAEEFGERTGICSLCNETITEQIDKLVGKLIDADNNATVEGVDGLGFADDVQFIVNDITDKLTENELASISSAIASLAEGKEKIRVFDLELLLNGQKYEFSGKVKVTIPLDADILNEYKDIQLIHIEDNNIYENISFTDDDGKLVFETTSFSNFVLVGVNTSNNGSGNNNQGNNGNNSGNNSNVNRDDNPTSPQTGDDSRLGVWIILMIASAMALIGCLVFGKKRSHNH